MSGSNAVLHPPVSTLGVGRQSRTVYTSSSARVGLPVVTMLDLNGRAVLDIASVAWMGACAYTCLHTNSGEHVGSPVLTGACMLQAHLWCCLCCVCWMEGKELARDNCC